MTLKVKVGSLTLAEACDVNLPQEYAAYYQTVRVLPGVYEVYAYLDWTGLDGGTYRIHELSAQCAGTTIASSFSAGIGDRSIAHIQLPTFGRVCTAAAHPLLAQTVLDDVIERETWDPRNFDSVLSEGPMWHFVWRKGIALEVDEAAQPRYASTKLARVITFTEGK